MGVHENRLDERLKNVVSVVTVTDFEIGNPSNDR